MTLEAMNIAIIGGGIGGLTAAIAFRQKGATVTLFEQAAEIGEVGAGLQISANAVRVLRVMGLNPLNWPHNKPHAVELRDFKRGQLVANIAMNTSDNAPYLQFHRADLISALYDAAVSAGVDIQLGVQASPEQTGKSTLEIEGKPYDLAVGADGVRSPIRNQFYDAQEVEFTGNIAWRALINTDGLQGTINQSTRVYMGPKKHVVIYPLRDGKMINIVAVEECDKWTEEGWNHNGDPDDLRKIFQGWCPEVETLLAQVQSPIVWGLFAHPPLQNWVKERVVLLGDSAHPMVPFIAQGACMAIEDAWVLADQLAKNSDISAALSRYQDIRKPRTARVQKTGLSSGKIYHVSNPVSRKVLHMGMKLSTKIAPSIMSRHYDWIYKHDVTKD
jgi:salicylate hydroxylase